MRSIFVLLTLILIILSGCQNIDVNKSIEAPNNIELCRDLKEDYSDYSFISKKLICYINYGKLNGNSECDEEEKELCDIGIAASNQDISYCDNSRSYYCFIGLGLGSGDANLCNQIEEDNNRNLCVYGVAIANKDINLCDSFKMDKIQLKDSCYLEIAKMTNEIAICDKMESYMKEGCYYMIALEKENIDLCDNAGENRVQCKRKITFQKAIESGNVEDCYKAGEFDEDTTECVFSIAINKKDVSICDELPGWFDYDRDECYNQVASEIGDISICANINDPIHEGKECYERLTSSDTYKLCHELPENHAIQCYLNSLCKMNGIKSDCYKELESRASNSTKKALEQNNAQICEGLGNMKPLCYFRFAIKLGFSLSDVFEFELFGQDEELCNKCPGNLKEKCYFNLAIEELNENYCSKSGLYLKRCAENVFLIKKNLIRERLMNAVQSRIGEEESKLGIKFSMMSNAENYFPGQPGSEDVYNDGYQKLDGNKFRLYKNFKLIDIDGCLGNEVVFPKRETSEDEWDIRHCILEFNTKSQGHILEITYDDKTIFVDYD